jgi:hypothetical protein
MRRITSLKLPVALSRKLSTGSFFTSRVGSRDSRVSAVPDCTPKSSIFWVNATISLSLIKYPESLSTFSFSPFIAEREVLKRDSLFERASLVSGSGGSGNHDGGSKKDNCFIDCFHVLFFTYRLETVLNNERKINVRTLYIA